MNWCCVIYKFSVFSLILLISRFVFADTSLSEGETIQHSEVFVIAQPIAADEVDTDYQTSHVTVIPRESFEGELATVADVLKKQKGVQIRRLGGVGSYSTVNIRGASGSQVNVYLDGVLLNGAFGGVVDLSQFLLGAVESIEIYRGNVPVQLGGSSVGGAVNIKTLRAKKETSRQLSFGTGSFDTKRVSATAATTSGDLDTLATGEFIKSNNRYDLVNEKGTYDYKADDTKEKRNNADFEQYSGLVSSQFTFDEDLMVQGFVQGYQKEQGLSELQNNPLTRSQLDTRFLTGQLKMNYWSNNTSYVVKVFGSQKEEVYKDLQSRIGVLPNNEKGITTNLGLGFQLSRTIYSSHLISFNAETKAEKYTIDDYRLDEFNEFNRLNTIAGIQDDWVNAQGDLLITLGSKLQHIIDDNGDKGFENSGSYSSVYSGLRYDLTPAWLLQFNLAREVRVPLLNEKFGDRGYTKGTEELENEIALNSDIGFKFSRSSFSGSLVYFYRHIDDAILTLFDSQGVGKAQNISESDIHGLELESSYRLGTAWSFLLSSTWQHSEDLSDSSSAAGKLLPGLYKREAFMSASYRVDAFEYIVELEYQSGGFYDSSNTARMPSTKQANLMAIWRHGSGRLELAVDNLNNQVIQDFNRYPSPGRNFSASYTYNF